MTRKTLSETVTKMYEEGLKDENFVMEAVQHTLGGTCEKSSKNEDMYDHIDFWWDSPKGGRIGVDVKGMRKNKRDDKDYDDSINWLEFMNVNGNLGWLYGKAQYIAFRTKKNIIFVKLDKLRPYAEEKVKGKELVFDTPRDFYVPYQRRKYGRKDMSIKVPTDDLLAISDFVIDF
jgi:hypothetical protein